MVKNKHYNEMLTNSKTWDRKALLRQIYHDFYKTIACRLNDNIEGISIEIGSGIGAIKETIPSCICTDTYDSKRIDQVENVYSLSFDNNSASNVIMFDVFHHIRYPGSALAEIKRVLSEKGHLIIFEPYISLLGWLIYGLCHNEPIAANEKIEMYLPEGLSSDNNSYYAAQKNAMRIFCSNNYADILQGWEMVENKKFSAISHIASGGFSKPQLYPTSFYPFMKKIDRCYDLIPQLFATRMLVVLKKRSNR